MANPHDVIVAGIYRHERTGVWTDREMDAICDLIIRRQNRKAQDAQDAEAKRAAAKEKRERKARRDLTE